MRLKEIIAEWLYYTDAKRKPEITFDKQDSNIRDFYHRAASGEMQQLLAGYFGRGFEKIVRGVIQDVINTHGCINKENKSSAAKRIARLLAHFDHVNRVDKLKSAPEVKE